MIKFFRRIRKKLIVEGNVKRYLIYATGEILLVMVGILLAFQVNTWSQERQNKKLEEVYLKRLIQDLNQDSFDLFSVVSKANVNVKLCTDVINQLGDSIPDYYKSQPVFNTALNQVKIIEGKSVNEKKAEFIRTFGEKLTQLSQHRSFDLARVTFDDLLSTGNIDVIHNEELRIQIQNYYSRMTAALDYEGLVVRPYYSTYINVLQDLGLSPYSDIPIEHIKLKTESHQKLIIALKFLLNANLNHLKWSNQRDAHIQSMKLAVAKELSEL